MGDRAHCRLEISGILAQEDLDRLIEAIDRAEPDTEKNRLRTMLLEGLLDIEFEEVNYAALDTTLEDELKALDLSFQWSWSSGDEYGPGVALFDARTGERQDFSTIEGDIALTLRDVDTEGRVEEIRRWERFMNGPFPLVVYRSNHHLLELGAEGKLPAGYLELRRTEAA